MFEIDGVFHDIYFLFCSWIQTVDSTPPPVHTPTLRKKACPGSTGFPAKVLNLRYKHDVFWEKTKTKKNTNSSFLLLVIFAVDFTIGFLKIANIKAWK